MSRLRGMPRPDAQTVEDVVLLVAAIPLLVAAAALLIWRRERRGRA